MPKRRHTVEVQIITTPSAEENVIPIKSLTNFKHSVRTEAKYSPEKNSVYRGYKQKMDSAKVR